MKRIEQALWLGLVALLISDMSVFAQQLTSITVHPATALPAGNTILVRGTGFFNSCGVDILLDSANNPLLSSVNVDSSGSFSVQLNLPRETTAGGHDILARGLKFDVEFCGGESSDDTSQVPIIVESSLPLVVSDITDTTPGGVTKLKGDGFCSEPGCSQVTVLIDGLVVAENITVNTDGTFNTEAMIPAVVSAGAVTVVATQTDSIGNELRAFDSIIITVRPNSDAPRPTGPEGPS